MILAAGARLSAYVASTVGEIGFIRGVWLYGSRRLAWLEDYAASVSAEGDTDAPTRLQESIELRDVSFTYPGSTKPVLVDVNVRIPAGMVVAVVGENGAGKSTLVKLLAKFYEPDKGEILVDGLPLRRIRTADWRERLAGAFQDFTRLEFPARTSIGVGDLPHADDDAVVSRAAHRAGADDVVARPPVRAGHPARADLARRRRRQLRPVAEVRTRTGIHAAGAALADARRTHRRAGRRDRARAVRALRRSGAVGRRRRRITVLVSHRFSTVRMADLIIVLDGSSIAQVGSHEELMQAGGPYSELYLIQQEAYR